MGWIYLLLTVAEAALLFVGPFAVPPGKAAFSDWFYGLLLAAHLPAGVALLRQARCPPRWPADSAEASGFRLAEPLSGSARVSDVPARPVQEPKAPAPDWRRRAFLLLRLPELLFCLTLLLFLFAYIYALNANMDYVQRFITTGGAVRLALDTTRERLQSAARYLPFLLLDLAMYLAFHLRPRGRVAAGAVPSTADGAAELPETRSVSYRPAVPDAWALPLVALSGLLTAVSFPSFLDLRGIPVLAWAALVPLLLVLESVSWRRALLYGTFYGVLQGMLSNFWLGTFSLISLQVVSLFFFVAYLLFLAPTLWLVRRWPRASFLLWPLAWVFFDYLRSSGFLGYPWGMLGTSQYAFTPLIQLASLTGVWGVSFVVLLVNAALAAAARWALAPGSFPAARRAGRTTLAALALAAGLFLAVLGGGLLALDRQDRADVGGAPDAARTVRVALVQQNSDPRKDDYGKTFDTLVRLTEEALRGRDGPAGRKPDLVAWSETAFVPNIRRWSREDPAQYPLAGLVRRFLAWQRGLGTWLLTGNDDYELVRGPGGRTANGAEKRLDFNASVLFSPRGERTATYHKVHLVPFTEYFPFQESLPGVYALLQKFDVYLWEPGRRRVVFRHPLFTFATPICFEDAFPDDIRRFVRAGAEVILNISNDYWSLTEVEARQHFINSLFRSVENRRVLLRSTASGLTGYVDPQGRLRASLPVYTEGSLTVDVPLGRPGTTFYTRYGDWFPQAAGSLLLALLLIGGVSLLPGRFAGRWRWPPRRH